MKSSNLKGWRVYVAGEGGLGPLVHTVCSVRTTGHFQKNETGACFLCGHNGVYFVFLNGN